jgi:hypothetical protein
VGCHHFTVVGVLGHYDHRMVRERVAGVSEHGPEQQRVSDPSSDHIAVATASPWDHPHDGQDRLGGPSPCSLVDGVHQLVESRMQGAADLAAR